MGLDLSPAGDPPFTLIRIDGGPAPVLFPGVTVTLADYVARLRESDIFSDEGGEIDALAMCGSGPEPQPADWLVRDATDPLTWCLQAALVRLAALEPDDALSPGAIDSAFGERTEAAVRAFQQRRGLTVDGIAGAETLDALAQDLAARGVTAIPLRGAELPRVGIVLSHPRMLLPGADGSVDLLVGAVASMGCRPVLLPPCADVLGGDRDAAILAAVRALDGLLGPGGDDVDPAIYGEENQYAHGTNHRRDRYEAELALAALRAPMFLFGICRSHQLWNAADGGSLVQDVVTEGRSQISQNQGDYGISGDQPLILRRPDGSIEFENKVDFVPGSDMAIVLGVAALLTNSFHHQAVDVPGKSFRIVGTVWDEVVKRATIEATERWNTFTTQFHPEGMQNDPQEHDMFSTLGRRAHAFRLLRAGAADPATLKARMAELPASCFLPSDFAWVDEDLSPELR